MSSITIGDPKPAQAKGPLKYRLKNTFIDLAFGIVATIIGYTGASVAGPALFLPEFWIGLVLMASVVALGFVIWLSVNDKLITSRWVRAGIIVGLLVIDATLGVIAIINHWFVGFNWNPFFLGLLLVGVIFVIGWLFRVRRKMTS